MQYESAVGVTYAWVYFLLVVVVGSVFILNLWIGVLTRYIHKIHVPWWEITLGSFVVRIVTAK